MASMLRALIRPVLLQNVNSLTFGPEDLWWRHANQKSLFQVSAEAK